MSETSQAYSADTATPARALTAAEVNERIRSLAQINRGNRGVGDRVETGIRTLDKIGTPMSRGSIGLIVGETNHGKSPLAATIAYNVKERIKRDGTGGAVVIFLTEETVEKRQIQLWGDSRTTLRGVLTGAARLDEIDANIRKSNDDPIYFIGDSADISTADLNDETLGILTPRRIALTMQKLVRMGVKPEIVIVDHIHDLQVEKPSRDEGELHEAVGHQLVALASALKAYCPVLYVAQAKQNLATETDLFRRLPEVQDMKFMSVLKYKASHVYSISYPKKFMQGKKMEVQGKQHEATTGLFVVKAAKLRDGNSGELLAMTALDEQGHWRGLLTEI